jgi:ATP-binding protein involved in chromosome partitioning
VSFRTYHQVEGADRSGLLEQVLAQRERVALRLARVERVIVVMSGKGGVGKSWVTAALALACARRARAGRAGDAAGDASPGGIGVVDADLNGPTVARLLGAAGGPLVARDDGVEPATGRDGVRVISTDLLLDEGRTLRWATEAGEAHTWRGVAEAGVLREFLSDVRWGALRALLVDMPPDAGRLADLPTLVPRGAVAVAVTIPTEESRRSVARALDAARGAGLPVAGVIENMSGAACPRCGATTPLFPGDAGARLAAEHGVPLLARLPFTAGGVDATAALLAPVADALLASRPESPA